MPVPSRTMQFGWAGDGGLGLRLIAQIRAGKKTATCCPVAVCTAEETAAMRANVGHVVAVVDRFDMPHCAVRVLDVFETPWGSPDPRLVRGEGHATADEFRAAHAHVWDDVLAERGLALRDDTALLVEAFELVGEGPPPPRVAARPSA
jgi:uncharacterized protein YhfF